MEDYLDTFHKMKDIFLEFRVTKCIRAKIDGQQRELRHDRPKTRERIASSKRRRMRDAEREEETERRMDLIFVNHISTSSRCICSVTLVIIYASLAIFGCIQPSSAS